MRRAAHAALAVLCGMLSTSVPASAQRLLDDWLVRTGVGPMALQAGPTAVFWNPALVAQQATRGSAVLLQLLAPEGTGVDVVAVSGGWRLDERTTVAAGFEHFGIEGVEFTETSPEAFWELDLGQDLFAAAVSRRMSERLWVGANAHYLRSSAHLDAGCAGGAFSDVKCEPRDRLSVGLGARWALPLPIPAVAAGYAHNEEQRTLWGAGVEVAPKLPLQDWAGALRLGAGGGRAASGITARGAVAATWRNAVEVAAGVVAEPDARQRQWEPELSATFRVYRYELGVVREWLPNSFGTVHTFRFGVTF